LRTLAIESATAGCSVALFDDAAQDAIPIAADFAVIGRGHAERLVPMIAALPGRGQADRILVSLGPGSFTGVRIGLAAARALGLAWHVPVLGYPTLALVAAIARLDDPGAKVTVCMTGGHGEWFVQDFAADGMPEGPLASLTPAGAAAHPAHNLIAGSMAGDLAAGRTGYRALDLLPDARHALALSPALLTPYLAPLYGRAPDARLPSSIPGPFPAGAA
jgi:tRNA threonylcarbamoyl adenosine modification protein YeaZ